MASREIEQKVQAQYEQYPYPLRSHDDDAERVGQDLSPLESLRIMQHYGQGGRAPSRPLRILVAGGGTGDATVGLGCQLQQTSNGGEIVHLDLSEAAIGVTIERVERMDIRNVSYWHRSLLDIGPDELGTFDYINCSGVLHHLPDPWAGVRALRRLLNVDGVLGAMVYGPYGRNGLYQAQELLRRLTNGYSTADAITIARRVLARLPKRHPLASNGHVGFSPTLSDNEIVDRYLHPCDQAFSVPQIVQWMQETGMRVVDFTPSIQYNPALLVADPWMIGSIARMPLFDRYAMAELWSFHLDRHSFFAVRDDNPVRPLEPGPDVVAHVVQAHRIARSLQEENALQWVIGGATFKVPLAPTPLHWRIFGALDDRRTLGAVARDLEVSWDRFIDVFLDLYTPLQGAGYMTLSDPMG